TDGARFSMTGSAIIGDTIETHLKLEGSDLDLAELIKYAPKEMLDEYGLEGIQGIIYFKTSVDGFYADSLLPRVDASIKMEKGKLVTKDYPTIKNIHFNGSFTNGALQTNQTTSATFESVHVEIGNSSVDVAFSVSDLDHMNYDVKTNADIDINDFKSFIPDSLLQSIDGRVVAELKTKGQLPDSIGDDFTDYVMMNSTAKMELRNFNIVLDSTLSIRNFSSVFIYEPNRFLVKNLNIRVPEYKVKLKNTGLDSRFTGSVNHMDKMTVDVTDFHFETDSSLITGAISIKNLEQPVYKFSSQLKLNLAEIKTMLPDSLVSTLGGEVTLGIASAGKINLDSIAEQANDLVFNHSTFKIALRNLSVELPDSSLQLKNLSGKMEMEEDTIVIDNFGGNYSGIDFMIRNAEVWNVYKTIMQGRTDLDLVVQTDIELGTIENAFIQAMMATDSTAADSTQAMANKETSNNTGSNQTEEASKEQPLAANDTVSVDTTALLPDFKALGVPHFLIRGKMSVDKITYEKNVIDDISLLFRFSDSLYVIDQFKLKTCGGEVNTSLKFDARKWEQPVVDIKNAVEHLDVKQLLMVNDNFGDTALTYDKVSGILTSDFNVRAFYVKGDWPTEKIRAKGILKLTDGKIYNYPPLVDLSMSIGGLKELDKLDFNTLTTSIFVFKNKIYIPKTDIVSSALDISAAAMQSFKEDFEYHLVLHLNDVLVGKSEKLLKQQAEQSKKEGETEERDGLKLVAMEIAPDKKYGFDNVKLYKKFLNEINKQEGFLNLLFNPLLVNFSTDFDRTIRNKELLEKLNNPGSGTKE
ncbi:MAG: hypothetical protein M0P66_12170, partial [Salinivirgaceae bacterium]|nr:hypothetical protein [Salinivirgaceae bacterium]